MDRFEKQVLTCLLTPLGDPRKSTVDWGIAGNWIGGSGVGKSARLRQLVRATGMNCHALFAATKTPEHIGGFPAYTPEGGFSLKCALPQVLDAMDEQRAVIFLDEISTAPPAVQAALLSFVNERTVGEYALPPGVRIVMAMNPADMAANGHDLEAPMANRIAHFQYNPPTVDQWVDHLLGRSETEMPDLSSAEETVRQRWTTEFAQVASLVGGFMRANNSSYETTDEAGNKVTRSKLYDQPAPGDPRASGPWPSMRTWEWAVYGMTTARCLDLPEITTDIAGGLVGEGLAVEYTAYSRKVDLPPPDEVLRSGKVPRRIDAARVVLNSASNWVVNIDDKKERAEMAVRCWKLLGSAIEQGYADIAKMPAVALINGKLDLGHPDSRVQDAAEEVLSALQDSGIMKYA